VHQVGFVTYSFFALQTADASGKPVEGAYEDSNADGIINANDKYIYKNPDPKQFCFASTLNYKNLDFFNLRASVGIVFLMQMQEHK
jgi:iron complex outermembrane receptor protein